MNLLRGNRRDLAGSVLMMAVLAAGHDRYRSYVLEGGPDDL